MFLSSQFIATQARKRHVCRCWKEDSECRFPSSLSYCFSYYNKSFKMMQTLLEIISTVKNNLIYQKYQGEWYLKVRIKGENWSNEREKYIKKKSKGVINKIYSLLLAINDKYYGSWVGQPNCCHLPVPYRYPQFRALFKRKRTLIHVYIVIVGVCLYQYQNKLLPICFAPCTRSVRLLQ